MTKKLTLSSIFLVLIIICSYITIPIFQIPFTMQVFAIFLTANILEFKYSFLTILSYIIMGLIGIPVFAGATSGFSVLFSGSGGFIIGFLFSSIIINISLKFELIKKNLLKIFILNFLALIVLYLFGFLGIKINLKMNSLVIFNSMISFFILDLIKIILVCILSNRIKKQLKF